MTARKFKTTAVLVGAGILCAAAGLHAQDYLGTHLDTMREHTLRQHQQDMATPRTRGDSKEPKAQSCLTALPAQQRTSALRRHGKQFRQVQQRDGMEAAYCWLKAQVDAGR